MKRFIVSVLVSIVAVGHALAADLPQPPPPPPQAPVFVPVPVYNWSGIYVGINGGYGFGNANWSGPLNSGTSNANGGLIGGTLGVNFQSGAFVAGIEGDFDWSGINSNTANTFCAVTANCQTGNTWLSTLRGRAGFASDRILFYGTAGGVFGNEQLTANGATSTKTQAGWTAGAGVEAAFAENWTAKLEYLYMDLGKITCGVCGGVPVSVTLTNNIIRAGINYKFNF
jgi:outer membrane immunogenic protein